MTGAMSSKSLELRVRPWRHSSGGRPGLQRNLDTVWRQQVRQQRLGRLRVGGFQMAELLVVESAQLSLEPLPDLGPGEPPRPTDLAAGQMSRVGQLVQLAAVAPQQAGQLLQVNCLVAHGVVTPLCRAAPAGRTRGRP